mmetsp:Transcript_3765/g.5441  ORF Transcript_3765/g.5441 Transcript_3765/m.5441 type:complete len:86 (+) Transcript_3765:124-381(+)
MYASKRNSGRNLYASNVDARASELPCTEYFIEKALSTTASGHESPNSSSNLNINMSSELKDDDKEANPAALKTDLCNCFCSANER